MALHALAAGNTSLLSGRPASSLALSVPSAQCSHPLRRATVLSVWSSWPASCSNSGGMLPAPLCTTQASHVPASRPATRGTILCRGQPGLMNLPLDRDLEQPLPGFDSIAAALEDLAQGKFVVVLDDEDRENEGDLIIAADKVTPQSMHYMVEYTSGVICIAMEGRDLDRLRLPLMVSSAENEESMYTAFTVTVDLREGITTGISAADRAKTLVRLADPAATAADFRKPGHIFPLRYREGGVLVRPGHTEASVDLARLAGCAPAGVLCEIVSKRDGSMARMPELVQFAKDHGLKCITIADLIRYRLKHEQLVQPLHTSQVLTRHGPFTAHTFSSLLDGSQHVALVVGQSQSTSQHIPQQPVVVHVHQEAPMSDALGLAPTTAAGSTLDSALAAVAQQGQGVVVYMRSRLNGEQPQPSHELGHAPGNGNGGLSNGAAAAAGREGMDIRVYGLAAQMLKQLGLHSVAMLPGAPQQQAQALASCGLQVVQPAAEAARSNGNHVTLAGAL